jgi:hypothetical protein
MHTNSELRLRQRTYSVARHVRFGHVYVPVVRHPKKSRCSWGFITWQQRRLSDAHKRTK